jgi:hypothetical protein
MLLWILLGALLMGACRSAAVEKPIEGELLVGQGGGFTGLYSGYLLRSDGVILRWSQFPGQPERTESAGVCPADSLQPFLRQLEQWRQRGLRLQGTGNMVVFLELRRDTGSYRLQWELGEADVPSEVLQFHRQLQEFLQRHLP